MRVVVALAFVLLMIGLTGTANATPQHRCELRHHAKCAGADLSGRNLRGVTLHHADLHGATLERADLRGAVLHHANLRGAHLRGAKLHHRPAGDKAPRATRTVPACSPNCEGADLSYADLTNAELAGADLRYANLTGANLTGAELRSANLAYANLTSATLTGADFTDALNCASALPSGTLAGKGCADDAAITCYSTVPYSDQTGMFTVSGNTFSQTSTFAIPDSNTQITSLTVNASAASANVAITSTSRSFTAYFSGTTQTTFSQSLSGTQAPWTTNTGTTYRSLTWNVADTGYGAIGTGRIRINGAGTLSVFSQSPDQRIRVVVSITGTQRVATPCAT